MSKDGITSSEGPSITFERDVFGRITRITGPSGEYRRYNYNTVGDLTSTVTGMSQTIGYDYSGDHLLAAVPSGADSPAQVLHFGSDG